MTVTVLDDIKAKLADILNADVQAPVTEKMWTTLGPEIGKYARKSAVIFLTLFRQLEQLSEVILSDAWNP